MKPHGDSELARQAIADKVAEPPGAGVAPSDAGGYEVTIAPALDTGHESHFALVLDEFLSTIDEHRWPAALAERTLAKYTLLAEAAARTRATQPTAASMEESS